MTIPTERIGDKGQRYEVKFGASRDGTDEHVLGWANDLRTAEAMAQAWSLRPEKPYVWIVDRHARPINEADDLPNAQPTPPVPCPTSAGSDA